MLFFVVYTSSEYLYRKTSKVLVIFISFIIAGQYYFSLNYMDYKNDPVKMKQFEWLNFYQARPG